MSFNKLIIPALSTLLEDGPIANTLVEKAAEKAIAIFQEHFTFSAFEIANSYQKSYGYALAAISAGLAMPEQKLQFIQKFFHSKIKREFADQIEQSYLQPFAAQLGMQTKAEQSKLRKQLIDNFKKLNKLPPIFSAEHGNLTESELANFINYQGALAITDLILEQLFNVRDYHYIHNDTLEAFFKFQDLLGNATLFFLRETFRRDERAKATIDALQRESLLLDMRNVKATEEKILSHLEQQKNEQNDKAMQALQAGNFTEANQITSQLGNLQKSIDEVPQNLQAAQVAWQNSHQQWLNFAERFHNWGELVNSQLNQVLAEMDTLHWEIAEMHEDVKGTRKKTEEISDDVKDLKQLMTELLGRFGLSAQVKLSDEFTHHDQNSRTLIEDAIGKLKALPHSDPEYNNVVIMGGSLLSSTGNIEEAEKLFLEAFNQAVDDSADKALASFNLFLVRLRNKDYEQAFVDLQTAIDIDKNYALHDIDKYPMVRMIGAGGMGCVFLCHDQWDDEKQVVVKGFWEGRKGKRQEVFGEAMTMRKVAGEYVPKPLDCGYVDANRQERPYFVSEYIEGALDGEDWLKKHGAFDVSTGITVGIQIAKGLQVAHEKNIYHLDLKPANLLFKQMATGLMVKIIDFGLAQVATSLRQEAMSRRISGGKTQLGQSIAGTLLYAPPEQMGEKEYGEPSAKSDFYAFGVTLYRLMTNESPRRLNPRSLSDAPPELFDLLCDCTEPDPAKRPKTATEVVTRLEGLLTPDTTIVVSPTGDCQTISAAIEKAQAGNRILVKSGVYQEDLVIDKPIEIIGDGEVADIVVESQNSNCIMMKTDHALVRGLSLRNRAEGSFAVDIPQGQLTLEYCDITSDALACVGIHGSEAEGIISHCQIHDSTEDSGVYVYENGTGQIENCDIFANALAGIAIRTEGNAFVQHCQIHDGKAGGIYVYENGTGRIENCDIFANTNAGIQISEGGNPVVWHCQIHDGKAGGVFVNENGTGRIENCDIFANALAGIEISEGGNPVVQHCKIHDSKEGGGVYVNENGSGRIENCEIFANAYVGIQIRGDCNPVVQNCQIHDGKEGGVMVNENGTGLIENCEIFANALAGIEIKEGGNPVVQHCQIHDGKQGGIYVHTNGTGSIENCEIFANVLTGIEIKEGGDPVVQNCTIKENAYQAVYVHDNGAGTIENCDLRDNAEGAWYIEDGCQVRRSGNKE